jgi:hypothetical protein
MPRRPARSPMVSGPPLVVARISRMCSSTFTRGPRSVRGELTRCQREKPGGGSDSTPPRRQLARHRVTFDLPRRLLPDVRGCGRDPARTPPHRVRATSRRHVATCLDHGHLRQAACPARTVGPPRKDAPRSVRRRTCSPTMTCPTCRPCRAADGGRFLTSDRARRRRSLATEGTVPLMQVGGVLRRLQRVHRAEPLIRAEAWASPSALAHGLGEMPSPTSTTRVVCAGSFMATIRT